jgi:hypothetical protein
MITSLVMDKGLSFIITSSIYSIASFDYEESLQGNWTERERERESGDEETQRVRLRELSALLYF